MAKLPQQLYIDKKTFICIFKGSWDRYKKLCKYRKVEDDNVERLLRCGDPENGFIQIYQTDYFQDVPNMEDKDAQFFQKEKEQKGGSPRHHQLLLPTM